MAALSKVLIFLVLVHILGDALNAIAWHITPEPATTLVLPVYLGSIALLVVALVFTVALFIIKKQKWGSFLVIATTMTNRLSSL